MAVNLQDRQFSKARIPYGTWGTSFFPAWQMSPLAEVNIGQFASEAMNRILGLRKVPKTELEYLVTGSTIPWHWKFWNSPFLSSCFGHRIPGFHVEQACATGLQAVIQAANEVEMSSKNVVGVLTFDRTSDSPVGVFPERRAYQRTIAISDVWDNFGFDPATGNSMIKAAGLVARTYKINRQELDELTYHLYVKYFEARQSGFLDKFAVPLEVLNVQGGVLGIVKEDSGVRKVTMQSLKEFVELDTCVTAGTQTHAADGVATMLITSRDKARELSQKPEIDIQIIAKEEIRAQPSMMPEAPSLATKKLLQHLGLTINDIAVIKTHNPFAVNDLVLAKTLNFDWHKINNTGCSLVWGHPQGPTLTRLIIEGLEESVMIGGGYVLVCGCAAGDVGIAAIFKVTTERQ